MNWKWAHRIWRPAFYYCGKGAFSLGSFHIRYSRRTNLTNCSTPFTSKQCRNHGSVPGKLCRAFDAGCGNHCKRCFTLWEFGRPFDDRSNWSGYSILSVDVKCFFWWGIIQSHGTRELNLKTLRNLKKQKLWEKCLPRICNIHFFFLILVRT